MIVAIIQARMSSTRLPGKVLRKILEKPLLELMIERVRRAKLINKLMVATSIDPSDDPVEELCQQIKVNCFRGNLKDVLDRFYHAACLFDPDAVVRLTADCPLIEPAVIDQVIQEFLKGEADYVSNALQSTYPDGLDTEVFSFNALEKAWKEAELPSEREHVTSYIWKNCDLKGGYLFRARNVSYAKDLSSHRWVVDGPEDFELIQCIYEALYPTKPDFDFYDILAYLLEHPEVTALNRHIARNTGYVKSLREDVAYLSQRKK